MSFNDTSTYFCSVVKPEQGLEIARMFIRFKILLALKYSYEYFYSN